MNALEGGYVYGFFIFFGMLALFVGVGIHNVNKENARRREIIKKQNKGE